MSLPPYARVAVRLTYPSAEHREVIADLSSELERRALASGKFAAQAWLLREVLTSTPALLKRGVWRGAVGFESAANVTNPGGAPLESIVMDARFTLRRLRSRPLYTTLAALTLALGVGGAAAIYGISRVFLLEPLPYANESKLVVFSHDGDWSEEQFLYLRDKVPGFSGVAAYRLDDATLMRENQPAEVVRRAVVSSEVFEVLGVTPLLGRSFARGDDALNGAPTAVISYEFWLKLGGEARILGHRITLDGTPRTIVGVMPRGFWFPDATTRIWIAGPLDPENRIGNYSIVGRLAAGVQSGAASLGQLSHILKERFTGEQWPAWVTRPQSTVPLRDFLFGPLRPALLATIVAMGCILLIACANVASLMLGQVEGRTSELALRTALGAHRTRILQQILIESIALGLLAAVVGAAIATLSFRVLVASLPLAALAERVRLDYGLFGAALAISIAAAMLLSLVPLAAVWRGQLRDSLARVRTSGIGGASRLASALVVGQVAVALLMTAGAGLLTRSTMRLYEIEPGISRDGVAAVGVVTPSSLTVVERQELVQSLMRAVRGIAGVELVSMTQRLPLLTGWNASMSIPSHPEIGRRGTTVRIVAPDYFETMGMRVLRGRGITSGDVAGGQPAVVINQKLADDYFRGEDPIGKEIATGVAAMGRVVGIVNNVTESALTDTLKAVRYMSYLQIPFMVPWQTLVMRTARDPEPLLASFQTAIHRVAPSVAIQQATTMSREIDRAVGQTRQIMFLLGLLTSLALVLGSVGIYGVVAQFVSRRVREFSIRIALGMEPGHVVRSVLLRGTALVAIGLVVGFAGAMLLPQLVRPFLYGISAWDAPAMLVAIVTLTTAGVVASAIPAIRAARVDPADALREQ